MLNGKKIRVHDRWIYKMDSSAMPYLMICEKFTNCAINKKISRIMWNGNSIE